MRPPCVLRHGLDLDSIVDVDFFASRAGYNKDVVSPRRNKRASANFSRNGRGTHNACPLTTCDEASQRTSTSSGAGSMSERDSPDPDGLAPGADSDAALTTEPGPSSKSSHRGRLTSREF